MRLIAAILALLLVTSSAKAGAEHLIYYKHHHMKAPPTTPKQPGNWYLCPTPAGIFICVIGAMIIADEIKRAIDGPSCATMKPRKSYFGDVIDEPKLWGRPICGWVDPLSTRG